MKKRYSGWRLAVFTLLIAVLSLGQAAAVPAAANKALKLVNPSFANYKKQNRYKGAELSGVFLKNDKLKKKGMTFSATAYIPAKALKKAGDMLFIDGYLYLQDPKADSDGKEYVPPQESEDYLGFVETKFDIILRLNENLEPELSRRSWTTGKESKAGKYASIEKIGSYYKINLNQLPLSSKYFNPDDQEIPMITSKKYILAPTVIIVSDTKKAWKGSLYVDDLEVTSANRTQKITFDKKDYRAIFASNWASGKATYKIARPMK